MCCIILYEIWWNQKFCNWNGETDAAIREIVEFILIDDVTHLNEGRLQEGWHRLTVVNKWLLIL